MTKTRTEISLVDLYQKYYNETLKGKRLQKNGKLVSKSTLGNYEALLVNIKRHAIKIGGDFMINTTYKYSKRGFDVEKRKYKKFYSSFTGYLYGKNCSDNYVGMLVKNLRSFFIYLNQEKGYNTGTFYKDFYVRKEETPVLVLSREQLQFLINDKVFEEILPPHLKVTKDVFVLGCTIGLRFSDIMNLRPVNLEKIEDKLYIVNRSIKTDTFTRIKLPPYAVNIIQKYHKKQKTLIPVVSLNQFNKNLKHIGELAGWTQVVGKVKSSRGVKKEMKKGGKSYRFCDLLSSHVMRRTAITTLLIHGMPEPLVRKISGHAPGSKEFYKYVKYSETFLDSETDKVFLSLGLY